MNDRERSPMQSHGQQYGSGNRREESHDMPRQAHQWQSRDSMQAGGDWQSAAPGRSPEEYPRDYRFSGHYDPDYSDRASRRMSGAEWRGGSRPEGYGTSRSQDEWMQRGRSNQYRQQRNPAYHPRTYDASGGNDFADFTSEDYGGRDFYNRGGTGGAMHPSDSYRPSYGISSWWRGDDDDDRSSRGGDDYGNWRKYGESRGFLQRAGDEIASWFGDEDASRRREMDRRTEGQGDDHRGRGPSGYTRSDERIREDANDHLTHDWSVDATHIQVSVKDGEVTLDGTVNSRQAKRRAEDCVDRIPGVKHVQNNLRVQETSRSGQSTASYGGWSDNNPSGLTSSGQAGSTRSSTNSITGANTTEGVGSTATAGVTKATPTSQGTDRTS